MNPSTQDYVHSSDMSESDMSSVDHLVGSKKCQMNGDVGLDLQINGDMDLSARTKIDNQRNEDLVTRLIQQCAESGAQFIDLSRKGLKQIPSELLQLNHLEYIYLEGNQLCHIPENFFECFPRLKWLDLRHNYIVNIPSAYIGSHQNLRNLLLEHNELKSLPLELGLVMSLNGLNINNNPLEFPPAEVIEKGTHDILTYLRELLFAKSQGLPLNTDLRLDKLTIHEENESSSSSRSVEEFKSLPSSKSSKHRGSVQHSDSETFGPVPQTAALHKPKSYEEFKQQQIEKYKKAGALGMVERKEGKRVKKKKKPVELAKYPSPPSIDLIQQKAREERKLAKHREFNEKTDAILQRRKDIAQLKEWRDETKKLKEKKYMESVRKGTKDFLDPVKQAPFGIDEEHIKVPTNEERIKHDVREKHERIRRAITPNTRQKLEEERIQRDRELEKKIKAHVFEMQERRKKPKGTPNEEMEAARKELAIVKALQNDLLKRYQDLKHWSPG
ncbi:leucine-rich repeat-containing protein 27 isoform X2 [Lingula anatina]|uniref:Leucine-rich repeat-containing protein 27 isoform X2 n=1 Tax=Lingula anatina TaxID=7574 RepID=A0A1S3I9U2_LINAN|nr:leucine-rich repeat-containing protein 27 isoform X2 [Lingula anatina]|eukprot:XP_013395035.1 leucine-rich repeat-containing protein 27 isoform X2 [Lingula anatina]